MFYNNVYSKKLTAELNTTKTWLRSDTTVIHGGHRAFSPCTASQTVGTTLRRWQLRKSQTMKMAILVNLCSPRLSILLRKQKNLIRY
jgi:hypothetical protein